jgi:hypothetical protein
MEKIKLCKVCKREFKVDKYHPHQEVCSNPECQHKRQLLNQKHWRQENPTYFKYKERENFWQIKRANYLALWRKKHKKSDNN